MRGRKQYSLLVFRGDGVRVLRFNFPRPAAVGLFFVVAVAVSVVGALVGDWVQLRELTREAKTFSRQIAEQRTTIDGFNRRVAELRQEMTGWRELHVRIWEPFGPELTPGGRDRGIGGGSIPPDRLPARLSAKDELASHDQPFVMEFRKQMATLGFQYSDQGDPYLTNEKNVMMYHLLFFSQHPAGLTLWRGVRQIEPSGQRRLL